MHTYFDKDRKNVRTFASYEENDELFSDRNVFPRGCVLKMEKINENKTLTKNMPNVKWHAIPPVRGPNPQGVQTGTNKKITIKKFTKIFGKRR